MVDTAHKLDSILGAGLVVISLFGGAASCRAAEQPAAGAWLLGVEVQQRTFDTMSAGDARPVARGDAGGRVSIEHLLTPHWAVGISGHFGGTWLDWSDWTYNISGTIEDVSWSARFGVDRVVPLGANGTAFAGAGIEYGEARSWVRNLGPQQVIDSEGPRNFMTGGFARLGARVPLGWRTALCAEVSESFYGAHAVDPPFGTTYNWLGRSLAVSLGLRFEMVRGHPAYPIGR